MSRLLSKAWDGLRCAVDPAWGRVCWLRCQPRNEQALLAVVESEQLARAVLRVLEEAFALPRGMAARLLPTDCLMVLYGMGVRQKFAMRADDMEFERLMLGLEKLVEGELCVKEVMEQRTIADLLRWVERQVV